MNPPARLRTHGDGAYERLREALMAGELRPGQPITVRGLAGALGVSMTPAREAMGRLVAEGGLATGANRTVSVPRLTVDAYRELLDVRLALEPMAAARAVDRITRFELAELRRIQGRLRASHARGDYRQVLRHNETFHFFLYRRAGMPNLVTILEGLWLRIGPTLNFLHDPPSSRADWPGDDNHREILDSIAKRDGARMKWAVAKDLEDGGRRVIARLAGSSDTLDVDAAARDQ